MQIPGALPWSAYVKTGGVRMGVFWRESVAIGVFLISPQVLVVLAQFFGTTALGYIVTLRLWHPVNDILHLDSKTSSSD